MRITSSHRLFGLPEWIQVPRTKTYQAESDQKDKMQHAMDDNGIPSKEIHERHRERAITAKEEPDDTFQNLKRTNESRTKLALDPKMFNSSECLDNRNV
ncbi:hypothetical protein Tco_1058779 [Tanacetum coccineum]|uniref:Uncharacterized protein n=1 Tax=Tanacetum coccineum TaxID=301880 RepID=A0ABQ5H985_9ASTR